MRALSTFRPDRHNSLDARQRESRPSAPLLLRLKQENVRGSGMQVVIQVGWMVLVEFWINHAKGDNLSLVVDSKRAGENDAWRKSRHKVVEDNHRAALGPQESARSQRAAGLAHHLTEV